MMKNYISNRFEQWLIKRMPAAKTFTLNSGNTFVFPSRTGLHFLVSCFILFLLGTNYQNNLILFLVFFLCSFMFTCLLLSYQNLAGLTLSAVPPVSQFANKDCNFKLSIKHPKTIAQGLDFSFKHQRSQLQTTIKNNTVVLYSYSSQRGYFNPGRITVKSTFPFGLFNVWTHLDFDFKVLLFPSPIENKLKESRSLDDNAYEHSAYQTIAGVEQFSTLKNYQLGESLKSVAWKQVAQGRGWLSKQFEQSAGGDLLLDISDLNHLPLELRLSFLSHHIIELEKIKQRYSLTLNQHKIAIGSGQSHKHKCLQALALFGLPLEGSTTKLSSELLSSQKKGEQE
jgi:uncharacterized protein (DUF58 family)